MKIRYWLADLITGGALTRAENHAKDGWALRAKWSALALNHQMEAADLRAAMHAIAAMRTDKANATVRRMARVAEEAVK